MTLSRLPLSYCTNVHPGQTVSEVRNGLSAITARVRNRLPFPVAAGLWLAAPVIQELVAEPAELVRLRDDLEAHQLACHTLNAFPYGDFHSTRVKENVYLPDWSSSERLTYTLQCAVCLAQLLPADIDGSISTVPLAYKGFPHSPEFEDHCILNLLNLAAGLQRLFEETGHRIRLAIEPEPCCLLETTAETVAFFQRLYSIAAESRQEEIAREFLGVCYDVCHQAVEFEDIPASIAALDDSGIRINKLHLTCALELPNPAENVEGRQELATFAEQRYLHQTFGRTATGEILRQFDLTPELAVSPPPDLLAAESWRIHFHVPVDAESVGSLGTTRDQLRQAISAVAGLSYAPHLEVETYTWSVLPGSGESADPIERLIGGLSRELQATQALLNT